MISDLAQQADVVKRCGFSHDRLRSPGVHVARMRPRFSEFGITRLAEITSLDEIGWPVWAAIRPNAPTLSVSQGKGPSPEAAQASAIMEAVEMAVAERTEPVQVTAAANIAADGRAFDLLPAMVRHGRGAPAPDDRIGWVRGHDLMSARDVWVPAEAVQIDGADPARTYWQSTDGIGSGGLMIEAVMHGLFERVERDALELAQWRTDEEVAASCIDLHGLRSPEVSGVVRAVSAAGLHLRAFDITSDTGLPTVFATISPAPNGREAQWQHFDLASGSAARLDYGAAALAAIGEALQSRLTVISGARDDFQPDVYDQAIAEDLLVYPRSQPVHLPRAYDGFDQAGKLETVLDRLRCCSVERVIVVPLHKDDDFAVAKVVIPDLELPQGPREVSHGPRACRAAEARP